MLIVLSERRVILHVCSTFVHSSGARQWIRHRVSSATFFPWQIVSSLVHLLGDHSNANFSTSLLIKFLYAFQCFLSELHIQPIVKIRTYIRAYVYCTIYPLDDSTGNV
jgi:hypothetical protein